MAHPRSRSSRSSVWSARGVPGRSALASCALAVGIAASAAAQDVCFEPGATHPAAGASARPVLADLDGDADLDIVYADDGAHTLNVALDAGPGSFGPATVLVTVAALVRMPSIVARDFDGDGDNDLAVLSNVNLIGPSTGTVQVWRNHGDGTFAGPSSTGTWTEPLSMAAGDVDGDSDLDLVLAHHGSYASLFILVNDGTGALTLVSQTLASNAAPEELLLGDLDLDGDLDIVSRNLGGNFVLHNTGTGAFAVVPGATSGYDMQLVDVDSDGDPDLVTQVFLSTWAFAVRRNDGSGVFAPAATIPGTEGANDIAFGDFDGDGDPDLAIARSSLVPTLAFQANDGGGTFVPVNGPAFAHGCWNHVPADVDGDGDVDLVLADLVAHGFVVMRNCRLAGAAFCAGDGSGTACPCGNASAPGAGAGCLNSFGTAGTLRGAGGASIANDTFVLDGTGMTNSAVLYFQGTLAQNGGAGTVFGDGLRCVVGTVRRLGTAQNAGGASTFPAPLDPRVSVVGAITAPGERTYQVWYRNSATFCAAPGFNLTNGLRVAWFP